MTSIKNLRSLVHDLIVQATSSLGSIGLIPPSPTASSWRKLEKESPELVFGREFYNFMDGLDHPDPIDDLKQWSDNINEFMEGLCTPLSPYLVDDPWQQSDPVEDYQQ